MGGGQLTDRIDGVRRGSAVSRATMAVPRDQQGAALGEPDVGLNLSSETRMTIDSPRIISRDEARTLGLKRFFTGKPCKYGHVAERRVGNYACMKCDRAHALEWRVRTWRR